MERLYTAAIPVTLPGHQRVHPSMGSVMQGALMERIPSDEAAVLHRQGLRPYSQAIYWDDFQKQSIWRISFLTHQDCAHLIEAVQSLTVLHVKQKQYDIFCSPDRHVTMYTYDYFMAYHLMQQPVPASVTLTFQTTTSFKQQGKYIIFPDPALIYQSLLRKWNMFAPEPLEDGMEAVLPYYTVLKEYALQTASFHIHGRRLTGFRGSLTYELTGDAMIRRTAAMLLAYAAFAGIGIKTALGMGAAALRIHYIEQHKEGTV